MNVDFTITSLTWHLLWLLLCWTTWNSFSIDWWQFNLISELKFPGFFPHVIRFFILSFFTRRGRATFPSWVQHPRFLCRTRRWCGPNWTCRLRPRSWLPSWPTNLGSEMTTKNQYYRSFQSKIRRKTLREVFL